MNKKRETVWGDHPPLYNVSQAAEDKASPARLRAKFTTKKLSVLPKKLIIRSLQLFFSSVFPRFFDPFLWIICFSKRKIGFLVYTRLNGFNWLFIRKSKLMKLFFFLIESQVFSERNHFKKKFFWIYLFSFHRFSRG